MGSSKQPPWSLTPKAGMTSWLSTGSDMPKSVLASRPAMGCSSTTGRELNRPTQNLYEHPSSSLAQPAIGSFSARMNQLKDPDRSVPVAGVHLRQGLHVPLGMTLPQVEGQFGTAARAVTVEGQQPGTGCPIQTMTYQEVSVSVYPVSCFLPGRFGLPRS